MAESKYLTIPPATAEFPKGIPYIVGNEAAERFSFYGMRTILVIFMTECGIRRRRRLSSPEVVDSSRP